MVVNASLASFKFLCIKPGCRKCMYDIHVWYVQYWWDLQNLYSLGYITISEVHVYFHLNGYIVSSFKHKQTKFIIQLPNFIYMYKNSGSIPRNAHVASET